jgi:hypothetical protein
MLLARALSPASRGILAKTWPATVAVADLLETAYSALNDVPSTVISAREAAYAHVARDMSGLLREHRPARQ